MTEDEIISDQQNNYYELSDFKLDDDDVYDARCAEIFITLNRVLVFQCSFCNKQYGNFGYFLEHLSIQHFEKIQEQEQYETNSVESIQPDLDQVIEESSEENALDETLHEYDEYMERDKAEEIDESIISDGSSHSKFPEYGEDYLKEIENVVIFHKPHHSSDETQSTDQANLSLRKHSKSPRFSSSTEIKPTILMHSNASDEKSKPKSERSKGLFKCDICSKIYNRKDSMKHHLITHSSDRNHKCEYCGFAFKDRSNLKSHVVRCHTGKKNISCDICSKMFFTRTESEAHMRTHTGEKPYMCSFCGLAFQTASKMTTHEKRHTGKAPLECSYCKKELWSKQLMRNHLLVHTKEKPFACPICSARFPRRTSMLRHTKLHDK